MQFVVRDLRETGKEIDLHLTGEETEVDKFVVERLADPLLHLVRNAVSHGLEPAAERAAAGQAAAGPDRPAGCRRRRGDRDRGGGRRPGDRRGTGVRPARAAGLVTPDAPADPAALLDSLHAGLLDPGHRPTGPAAAASGMDVVRRAVEELGGTLDPIDPPGHGTRFTVRLPLTLAIADALIMSVGQPDMRSPRRPSARSFRSSRAATTALENNELLRHHGGVLPLLRLDRRVRRGATGRGVFRALVVGDGAATVALASDRVLRAAGDRRPPAGRPAGPGAPALAGRPNWATAGPS